MPVLTDYAKNLVTRALCARAPALPTQVFLGLGTGAAATGLTGEPAVAGYARQRVSFTGTGTQSNIDALRFAFTGAVGMLTHAGLFDAPAGGNALTAAPLAAPIAVAGPGVITIDPNELDITAD